MIRLSSSTLIWEWVASQCMCVWGDKHSGITSLCVPSKRNQWMTFDILFYRASGHETVADFELKDSSYPSLIFSRVRSYTAAASTPLEWKPLRCQGKTLPAQQTGHGQTDSVKPLVLACTSYSCRHNFTSAKCRGTLLVSLLESWYHSCDNGKYRGRHN